MKIIKFFSFAMLLSLAWVSCKNAATTETTEQTGEVMAAEVLATNKTAAQESLTGMQTYVATKITEVETALATATEATKAELTTQLENLKKYQADLQALSTKVGEATVENWSTVSNEVEALHMAIKSSLTQRTDGEENSSTTTK